MQIMEHIDLFGPNAKVIYEIEAEKEEEIYLYIAYGVGFENVNVYVNGEKAGGKYYGNYNKMIQLGKHKKGEKIRIEFTTPLEEFRINKVYICYENDVILGKYYERLYNNQVDLKRSSNSKYEGVVDIKNGNDYIIFTIPYDEGWNIKIDGKKIDKIETQDALMAVKCSEGSHKIEMNFTPKGFKLGTIISFVGIIILAIYKLRYRNTI